MSPHRYATVGRPTVLDASRKSFVSHQPRALARSRDAQKNVKIDRVKYGLNGNLGKADLPNTPRDEFKSAIKISL